MENSAVRPLRLPSLYLCCVTALGLATAAHAGDAGAANPVDELAPVTVQATAIPGDTIDADLVPGNVQTVSAADISRHGSANLTGALNRGIGSINLNENLDDPFQPDLLYRGFEASPVLGTPEGLAVYEDGVRINEAFGDAVNWDLITPLAIDRVSIVSASPVYGLNALGGGIAVSMKNGFSFHDADGQLYGGSFDKRAASAEYGVSARHLGWYVAADALNQDGWRVVNVDVIVFAQEPKLGPIKADIRANLASLLALDAACVNVKAKTGERVGAIGRAEAISCQVVALIERIKP